MSAAVDAAARLLAERIGLDADAIGRHVIRSAVGARCRALQLDEAAYRAALHGPGELEELIEEAVVAESWFGREPAALQYLAERALDWIAREHGPFRLLCLPCARGEEACSAVIALVDAGVPASRIDVLAVDVSARQIALARAGRYDASALRGYSSPHLTRDGDGWTIAPPIRDAIRYRVGNALDDRLLAGEPPFQAALVRNLLLYLTPDGRARSVRNLSAALASGGVLCVGSAESAAVTSDLQRVGPPEAVAFRAADSDDGSPAGDPPAPPAPRRLADASMRLPRDGANGEPAPLAPHGDPVTGLLSRPAPEGYAGAWARLVAMPAEVEIPKTSVVMFRLGREWLAIDTGLVREVAEIRPIQRVAHRTHTLLAGIVNIRGQLHLCVSLDALLDMPRTEAGDGARLVVLEWLDETWVFAASEVLGVVRFPDDTLAQAPATLPTPLAALTRGIFPWEEHRVAHLQGAQLIAALKRAIV